MRETLAARACRLLLPEQALWRRGVGLVAGVDEVGVGPLAGPVVAAAVVLPQTIGAQLPHLDDSKKMTARRRLALVPVIEELAVGWALGEASAAEVDEHNVYWAARLATTRAVTALARKLAKRGLTPIGHLLLDAHPLVGVPLPQTCLVQGDSKSQSIAAASVLAKVARDRQMADLAASHPGYGFERHAGYPTAAHLAALRLLGPCQAHRHSFRPVSAASAALRGEASAS